MQNSPSSAPNRYNLPITYIRDKRSPVPLSEATSRVMSANRAQNTKPELLLRRALWQAGHRGYRLHYRIKSSPPSKGGDASRQAGWGGKPAEWPEAR